MPKTEAGKRLAAELQVEYRIDLINDIEAEAEHRGYLRANDCDHSECIENEEEAYNKGRNDGIVLGRYATKARLKAAVKKLHVNEAFGGVEVEDILRIIEEENGYETQV